MSIDTLASRQSPIEEVWADLQQTTNMYGGSYEVDLSSSTGATVLLTDGDNPLAIKFRDINNRHDGNLLLREALLLAMLNEADSQPPLMVPKPVDGQYDQAPYYLAMERVSGVALGWPAIRELTPADKYSLGTAIGAFAAWMAVTIDSDQYEKILYDTSTQLFDRVEIFNVYYSLGKTVKDLGCSTLHAAFLHMADEFTYGGRYDELATLIGFDDIRPTNIGFNYIDGHWLATSLFDVGIMKPITAAREFRHLRTISRETSRAAAVAYQDGTGQEVAEEDIEFWAQFQAITAAVYSVANGTKYVGDNQLALKQLFPAADWSELDRFKTR